jgi:NitT/TauT family transport system permease protein
VAVVFLFGFVYMVVNTHAGVRNVRAQYIEMATSFGASERQIWMRVLIPGALPAIMTGLRLGLGRAVMGAVTIELLLVAVGIGKLMLEYRGLLRADYVFAVAFAVVAEAVVLMMGLQVVERRLFPWASGPSAVAD